ncbi:MAG: cytochrome c-type biogenesis protein CcmH [Gemmatimonadaceae bacterium]
MSRNEDFSNAEVTSSPALNRREFLLRATLGAGGVAMAMGAISAWPAAAAAASSKEIRAHAKMAGMEGMDMSMPGMNASSPMLQDSSRAQAGVVNMDGEFYKPVSLPARANATPKLNEDQMVEFERQLACPCPCTLDVYTCRTTDFSCGNSPAVHRDVQRMVQSGYGADEIMQAMIGVYGNGILMAPPKKGINLIAWFLPFAALGTGAVLLNSMLHKWRKNAESAVVVAANDVAARRPDSGATADEMARLRAALRDDNR